MASSSKPSTSNPASSNPGRFELGTFSIAGGPPFAGLVLNQKVIAISALKPLSQQLHVSLTGTDSILALLENWDANFAALQKIVDHIASSKSAAELLQLFVAVDQLQIHPPVNLPRQIFCSGANYKKHVVQIITHTREGCPPELLNDKAGLQAWAENLMDERIAHGVPYMFIKAPSAVTGALDPVVLPAYTQQTDWELELAVVIGRAARNVKREDALQYVAGYTIGNDISARDHIWRRDDMKAMGTDWVPGKNAPTFLPLGPYLVPAAFAGNVKNLQITLKLNGEIMQNESTADMIFDVARQIEYLSGMVQLWPGDVICTGSPAGNAVHHGNRFLRDGDVMESSITGLGIQRNRCIDTRS